MSDLNAFRWLDGTITVPTELPSAWAVDGLMPFYRNPNDPRWGGKLGRILYHESIHFWQLLSSAYLANAVQAEWLRYVNFQSTGNPGTQAEFVREMYRRQDDAPFSAHELVECWARYWDVHTRSPARLVDEDRLEIPAGLVKTVERAGLNAYTSVVFDYFMQHGSDAQFYAAPYRWMLEQAGGNSALTNILFPTLTFHAFGSRDPVAVITRSFKRAIRSDAVRASVEARSGSINLDWLSSWDVALHEAVEPTLHELRMPLFTAGWDVLGRGPLGRHPVYRPYHSRIQLLFAMAVLSQERDERPKEGDWLSAYKFVIADLPRRDPRVIFAFPGQPEYRQLLGYWAPPPRVKFLNRTLHAWDAQDKKAGWVKEVGLSEDELHAMCDGFDRGIPRFNQATYAVSLGFSADAFD